MLSSGPPSYTSAAPVNSQQQQQHAPSALAVQQRQQVSERPGRSRTAASRPAGAVTSPATTAANTGRQQSPTRQQSPSRQPSSRPSVSSARPSASANQNQPQQQSLPARPPLNSNSNSRTTANQVGVHIKTSITLNCFIMKNVLKRFKVRCA